jgi:uncharacterized protein YjbI with pentapeptide repeats
MANPKHLSVLRRGVSEWNQWREREPAVWPDLLGADVPEEKLDGINLQNANLLRANLEGASLVDANLRNANLKEANLRGAFLTRADLREANLYKAKLQEAEMGYAKLVHANLLKAEIEETRFFFATLGQTSFDQNLILGGRGLDVIFHTETSIIDVQIFEQANRIASKDPDLRESIRRFFQNAGVTERIVKAALEALARPPEWRSCFISYSHTDKEFVDRLCASLIRLGIPCCRDDQGITAGNRIFEKVAGLIINNNRTLLCCSWASLTRGWVEREAHVALEKEEKEGKSVLVPLDIDGCLLDNPYRPDASPLAQKLSGRLIGDFRGWRNPESFDAALGRLAETLRTGMGLTG